MSRLTARLKSAQGLAPTQEGLKEGERLLVTLKEAAEKGDVANAKGTLLKLKLILTNFQSLPPHGTATPSAEQERLLARSALEVAVFLSTREKDRAGFSRHTAQLKPYYMECKDLPDSPNRLPLLGLNLLYLLVENRLAEFHSELELLTEAERADQHVLFPVRLEQLLMVGSYDQVLSACRGAVPHPYYSYFLEPLVGTVRDAIASCSEVVYKELSLAAAQKMMMLSSREALQKFVEDRNRTLGAGDAMSEAECPGWALIGDKIVFQQPAALAKSSQIPAMTLITQTLSYATELERIV